MEIGNGTGFERDVLDRNVPQSSLPPEQGTGKSKGSTAINGENPRHQNPTTMQPISMRSWVRLYPPRQSHEQTEIAPKMHQSSNGGMEKARTWNGIVHPRR